MFFKIPANPANSMRKLVSMILVAVVFGFLFSQILFLVKRARTLSKLADISKSVFLEEADGGGEVSKDEDLRRVLLEKSSFYKDDDGLLKDSWGGDIFLERDNEKRRVYVHSFGSDGKLGGGDDLCSYFDMISESETGNPIN